MPPNDHSDSFGYAIALDFEATCLRSGTPTPQEIIEFPSVVLALDTLEIEATFSSFVRPVHHPVLSAFCTELTTISQAQVDQAPTFECVFEEHQSWLREQGLDANNAFLVTCGDWDLKTMLPEQLRASQICDCPRIYRRWLNIKQPFCELFSRRRAPGMLGMLQALGLPLEGTHHRGIDDAKNIACIARELARHGVPLRVTSELGE